MTEVTFTGDAAKDAALLKAFLDQKMGGFVEMIGKSATKEEWAHLTVDMKDILSKIEGTTAEMATMKKEAEKFYEACKMQGESITNIKSLVGGAGQVKTFKKAVFEQLEKGVFNDFIDKKAPRASFQIDLKDIAFTGSYGSGAAQQAFMPFTQPQGPDIEDFDIRTIVPTGTINSEKLEYPQERAASLTDSSAWVTENDEASASAYGFTMQTANSKRATAWVKVSRRAMRNTIWLANYIQMRLLQAFIAKLNTGVIADDGSPATELTGMLATANTFDASTDLTARFKNADYFSVMRAARARMKKSYNRNANTILLDPIDYAILADSRTTIGDFMGIGSFLGRDNQGYNTINGMRVYETADVTDGGYLLADISPSTIQLLFNGPIELLASDSDDDNFTKNLVTLKIEADVMLPIYNANAFLKGTLETDLAAILKT